MLMRSIVSSEDNLMIDEITLAKMADMLSIASDQTRLKILVCLLGEDFASKGQGVRRSNVTSAISSPSPGHHSRSYPISLRF